jgi:hypothetical protein
MLASILSTANEFCEACRARGGSPAWFRGHARSNEFKLESTLHRHAKQLLSAANFTLDVDERRKFLRDQYKQNYRTFESDAWPLLKAEERSEWGLIFTMQHYGIPTRMLDWTESFLCALFFAHRGRQPGETSGVWALDPQGLNELALGQAGLVALDDFGGETKVKIRNWHPRFEPPAIELPSIAVAPHFTNPRMSAQRAAFTMMGDSFESLDLQFRGKLIERKLLMEMKLGPESYAETEDLLRLCGCSDFMYFPDLDGLARRHVAEVQATIRDAARYFPHLTKQPPPRTST